jgi:hypothetical protein
LNETISGFWRRCPETGLGYQTANQTAGTLEDRRQSMRTISFILAFAFVLAEPSMAGSSDHDLPGIGTFSYTGSPIAGDATQFLVVAAN